MRIELSIDGTSVVKIDIDRDELISRLFDPSERQTRQAVFSTPITTVQARDLISRLNPKTVMFLRELAKAGGSISWANIQAIFGVTEWKEFSNSYNRGITRALRNITKDSGAWLVNWNDKEWAEGNERVFIEGPALEALREAFAL